MEPEPLKTSESESKVEAPSKGMCGIVMPMSASGDYTEEHWIQMRTIIEDAAHEAGFEARIVSTNANPGILQSNLVNNLFNDEVIVCDLSDRNPNVMLELGLRIAFGKPFIVIMDRSTKFSSDIGVIIHILYEKDMLYPEAKLFKSEIAKNITAEVEASKKPGYKSFLSTFKVPNVNFDEVGASTISLQAALTSLANSVEELKRGQKSQSDNLTALAAGEPFLTEADKAYLRAYGALLPNPQTIGANRYLTHITRGQDNEITRKIGSRPELVGRHWELIWNYWNTLGLERDKLATIA